MAKYKNKFSYALALIAVLFVIVITACKKVTVTEGKDDIIVITLHDKSADFKQLSTFAIVDTIGMISDDAADKPLFGSESKAVLNNIAANFESKGFTRVTKYQSPDFVINVSAMKRMNDVNVYYPGYWYDYQGYYGSDYWGYGTYGYYYPWTFTYSYQTGSLIIEVIDIKHRNVTANKLNVIWFCLLNGYLDTEVNSALVNSYINKGFKQSSYLQR